MENLRSTYQGKRVFVTGHTGFKGSWLLLLLHELGAQVKGYALAPESEHALYHQIDGDQLCDSVIADIRDRERLNQEINSFQPHFIFHMAAQALVIESYKNPVETYAANVMGTIHVLDALREADYRCDVVVITTDKVYENLEQRKPYLETDRLGGFDPYSNSKACAELATSSYRLSFFHPDKYEQHKKRIATARSGNVIGGGDWSENRIVPDLIRALQAEKPLTMRNPAAVRPWQHVLDPLDGYLRLGKALHEQGAGFEKGYNFGPYPDDELTVQGLVETAIESWGSGSYETPELKEKLHEAGLLKLDINLAVSELGWAPRMDSRVAIETTVSWYKHYAENPAQVTRDQINAYYEKSPIVR